MPSQSAAGFDPSSLIALVTGLGAQTKVLLGLMENPLTRRTEKVDLDRARIFISTLEMLASKTKGNLTSDEERFLSQILTDVRLSYVKVSENKT